MSPSARNNFHLIRLLAASNVMLLHVSDHLHWSLGPFRAIMEAFPGVPIFFVVSGFLITQSWERSHDLKRYARNRFLRIYPALWVCFLVAVATMYLTGYRITSPIPKIALWVLSHFTSAIFISPSFLHGYGVGVLNGSLWTLPLELQFYLLTPFVFRWLPRWTVFPLIALFAGINAAGHHQFHAGPLLISTSAFFQSYYYMFLIGAALFFYFEKVRSFFQGKFLHWLAAYGVASLIALPLGAKVGTNDPNAFMMLLLACIVIAGAHTLPAASQFLHENDLSYGIYIYHMVVVNFLIQTRHASVLLAIAATYVLAFLSWIIVERPCLRAKKIMPLTKTAVA
jgi:peptidoglycan/LPS O-acetylase OafA/YrhL